MESELFRKQLPELSRVAGSSPVTSAVSAFEKSETDGAKGEIHD